MDKLRLIKIGANKEKIIPKTIIVLIANTVVATTPLGNISVAFFKKKNNVNPNAIPIKVITTDSIFFNI